MIRKGMAPAGPSISMTVARGLAGMSGKGPSPCRRRSLITGRRHRGGVGQAREPLQDRFILLANFLADGGGVEKRGVDHAGLGVLRSSSTLAMKHTPMPGSSPAPVMRVTRMSNMNRFLGGSPGSVLAKLIFLSLLVGAFMAFLGITPVRAGRRPLSLDRLGVRPQPGHSRGNRPLGAVRRHHRRADLAARPSFRPTLIASWTPCRSTGRSRSRIGAC